MCVYAAWNAFRVNGAFGFPLDDPWIHLQFARNLHDYGVFSYYKNEMATSGSTSPLYTALLALGFFIIPNEFALSYTFGIVFLLLSAFVLFKLARLLLGSQLAAVGAALLLLFEPRLEWVALSGMETTLFVLAILSVWYFYATRNRLALGLCAGLAIWVRPDAVIFLAALSIDVLYRRSLSRPAASGRKTAPVAPPGSTWLLRPVLIAALLACAYIAFNLWLSGSIFPNTYAAKLKKYSGGTEHFLAEVWTFITAGHLVLFSLFMAIGTLSVVRSVAGRKEEGLLLALLWPAGMILAYWKNLPYLYQEGRYLMPILPFIILLGLRGVSTSLLVAGKAVRSLTRRRVMSLATAGLIALFWIQFASASWEMKERYADSCRYIGERQVRTAMWIREHLPETACVATHDIGAIGFYSGRRVVDMVGLVSPEMIDNIGSLDKLMRFLIRRKVTHLAVLRNWFEVVNENPLFQTDELSPEIMEVFPFDPARTHFTPGVVGEMTGSAEYYLSKGDPRSARSILEQSLRSDPRSSRTHYLLGRAYLELGDPENADGEIREALRLHPRFWDARSASAEISVKRNRPEQAVAILEELLRENPRYAAGYRMLAGVYGSVLGDTLKSRQYLDQYDSMMKGAK